MHRSLLLFFGLILSTNIAFSQNLSDEMMTPFEKNDNTTTTYQEAIDFYKNLAEKYATVSMREWGRTDSGQPLHTVVLSKDGDADPNSNRRKGRLVLMINNGIHPGEPCGIDASMMMLRDMARQKELQGLLDKVVIVAIPIYNIGGALNRNSFARANQNGPKAYGFRGNARNLDLNRDFIKCDSYNARTFNQLFTHWSPDVLVDTHTSNGADYSYTMTLIATQADKLDPNLAQYLQQQMLPRLYQDMKARNWEMTPYVYARDIPDNGIAAFLDLPRYSSGYAALFNTLSFMPETHMLKPFKDRVESTRTFLECMIRLMNDQHQAITEARAKAIENTQYKQSFDLNWELITKQAEQLIFKGYEAKYKPSEISGKDRLYYDREATFEKEIPYFPHYKASLTIDKPIAYIIPQAYEEVVERMRWNGVQVQQLEADTEVEVELYRVESYKDRPAYEGHYLHYNVVVEKQLQKRQYYRGDYLISTTQPTNRYIVETLEPQAPASWFAWNFFDGILMQKEYFSAYVFEDLAARYLDEIPGLREKLEQKKKEDEAFAESAYDQLVFIYKHSPHYEPTHRIYPVGRLLTAPGQ
ncbi:MAG: M14 family metallopeptidase [Bacteroidota bacterium]